VHFIGSSRLGVYNINRDLVNPTTGENTNFERGRKFFELSNHLGNVLVTISDKKIGVDNNSDGVIDYYVADVQTSTDNYSSGMGMPGREYSNGNEYRYGQNGQEKSSEINKNSYTAEFWQYDARIVRRWNVDPKPNVSLSPYNCFGGNPIWMSDPFGDTTINGQKMEGRNVASATYLPEAVVTAKKKYVPEQDFMHNPLTGYNSKTGAKYTLSGVATTKSLLWEWVQNWQCNDGSCRNTIIVDGPLLDEVKNLKSVQKLFREGVQDLYSKNKKITPGGKSGDTDHLNPVQTDHPKLTSFSCNKKVVFRC